MGTRASKSGSTTAFLLGLAAATAALLTVGALWWLLPATPRVRWQAPGECHRLVVSADGTVAALVTTDAADRSSLTLYQTETGKLVASRPIAWLRTQPGQASTHVPEVWLSPDAQIVAFQEPFADNAGRLVLWNTAASAEPVVLPESWERVAIAWPYLVTAAFPAESPYAGIRPYPLPVKLWDLRSGAARPIQPAAIRLATEIVVGPGDEFLVVDIPLDQGARASVSRLIDGTELFTLPNYQGRFQGRDGGYLATADDQGLQLWAVGGRKDRIIAGTELSDGFLNRDGTRLVNFAWVSPPGQAHQVLQTNLWDVTQAPPRRLATFSSAAPGFSLDGKWLKTGGDLGSLQVWDAVSGEEMAGLNGWLGDTSSRFAPDSRSLAGVWCAALEEDAVLPAPQAGWSDTFREWLGFPPREQGYELRVVSLETGRRLGQFGACAHFAYLPDSSALVLAREAGAVEVWDVPQRRRWWIAYGLPVLLGLLLLLAIRHCVRLRRATS